MQQIVDACEAGWAIGVAAAQWAIEKAEGFLVIYRPVFGFLSESGSIFFGILNELYLSVIM